ncbi:hypothetical protein, partial [Halomonas sp. 707D7]|uniref:hypothetical protein n=1 Tax=Halomonas sp. 707D7 TaxID=1681044 RepID=UPI00209DC7DC
PTLSLAEDTGAQDGITSNGVVNVAGLIEGATWEFSLDGGTTWQAGSGDRFVLAEGDYAAGEVLVRQSDADGVTSGTRTVGSVIVDTTAPEAPSVALGNDTGTLDGITADGTMVIGGLEPGALWEVSLDGGVSWQRGVGDRFILAEGDYIEGLVQVRQIDRAGNVSAPVELGPVTVDLTAPQAPTLALDGLEAGITNETLVTVGNLEAGARWEFSLDGGASWTVGTGTSFSLPEGTYGLDQVQVRQTDGAGNVSPATALTPVVIDVTPPAVPVISLVADSAITNDATVSVEGLEEGARWEYSLNGGVSWVVGVGDSFELPEGRYAAGQILTRQIDAAGNVGGVASLGAVEIDITPPPTPLLTLID